MSFCANCGTSVQAGARFCVNCGAPVAVAAGAEPTTVTLPSPPPYVAPTTTSVQVERMQERGLVWQLLVIDNGGEEVEGARRFHWGAFLWPGIWPFIYGQWKIGLLYWVTALALGSIPVIGWIVPIGVPIIIGAWGYRLAAVASPGRWGSFDELRESQRLWAAVGVVVLGVIVFVMGFLFVLAMMSVPLAMLSNPYGGL